MTDSDSELRQQLEEQIALNQRMEKALQVSRAGTFSWDAKTFTFEWNAYCYELHGFPPNKGPVSYEEFFSRIPLEDRAGLERKVLGARDGKTPFQDTYRVKWPDESIHWISARGVWEYEEDGSPIRMFGIGWHATDQKNLELELAASEQRLRDAHDASQLGAWELDVEAERITVSAEFRKIHGITQESYNPREDVLGIPKSDAHVLYEGLTAVQEPGGEYDVEHRAVHGVTGETIWVRGRGRGVYDDAGNLLRLIGTNQDVTARKVTEIAFLETARVFRALTQASPGLIFRADETGRFTFINDEQWTEFSGLELGAWEGDGWLQAFHPADRDRAQTAWLEAVEAGTPFQEEYRWRHQDGQVRWLLLNAQPVFDNERVTSFVGTGTDVTALKTSERERATLQLALAESQKMEAVGTLASGVAHDFNNFLAAVRGYVELARLKVTDQKSDAAELASKYLEQAEAAIDQAKDVTNGLLTFSRGHTVEHQSLCLNTIVGDNVDLLRQLVPASINISCQLPNKELWIDGDSTQLRQILINLVVNSRDALEDEGGEVEVILSFEQDWAVVLVRDGGRGMSREEQERAIEPFYTTKQQGQGTGLGLSVVHGIVIAHGGEMTINSKRGKGTEVEIRLPLVQTGQEPVAVERDLEPVLGRQTILFVEDNPLVRESCALRMEASGYSIVTAEDGEQAELRLASLKDAIDVVLLDVDLPGENGVKVAQRLRALMPDLKVLYVTGNSKNPALKEAVDVDVVLPKPIDYQALFTAINSLTNKGETVA